MRGSERMVGIAGATSTIAREFVKLLPFDSTPVCDRLNELQPGLERYLICTGFLAGKSLSEITPEEASLTWRRNFLDVARFCDLAFAANPKTRICVIGSESGFAGSYDNAYSGSKAALHRYVETKELAPEQQLVCVAPSIIDDSGMTRRRTDVQNLKHRRLTHPKGRFLDPSEVAALAYFLLFVDRGYMTGTVIRMNGGPSAHR